MRVALGAIAIFLAPLLPADNWWLASYGFDQIANDGTGVVVAVIDTGVDDSHPDLRGTVIAGADFSKVGVPDGTSGVGSSFFHGTMVASLIVGQGSSESGVVGVAPGAKLLAISIGLGVEGADTDAQIANAITWAVDQGADIINLSLTRNSQVWPVSWDKAFAYAFENDVVIVSAAGNRSDSSSRPSAPGTIPGVVAVGGLNRTGESAALATEGLNIAITAPAEQLLGAYPGETYRSWEGSSAAAPLVSGLLALMKQQDPDASANDLIARLLESATDKGEPGFDTQYGFGVINPKAAIASTLTASENPLGSLSKWVELYRPSIIEEPSELVVPQQPLERTAKAFLNTPVSISAGASVEDSWASNLENPLLYWLLAPLAPTLWFALRVMRKRGSNALKKDIR